MRGWKVARRELKAGWTVSLPALLPLCLAGVLLSGCTRAQAKVTPDQPLDVPPPPPREVEVNDSEPPPPVSLIAEPARNAPARPRPAPPQRTEPARPDAKPETSPPEPPKPTEEPKPAATPPTTLQTTPATAEGEVERGIRASLARANSDLSRIDYRALNRDARTQYDTAKRFVQQADHALHEKNLIFAKTVADKAVVLAAQLAGR
jgi:outer membrane biosynthesis protein TonB